MFPKPVKANHFDITVVGGGPAASVCARLLALHGARVAMIDRGGLGIPVVEVLSGRCRRLLDVYAPETRLQKANGVEVLQTIALWNTVQPTTWSAILSPWGPGLAVIRSQLDEDLRQVAGHWGVTVMRFTQVRGVEYRDFRWLLNLQRENETLTLEADFLVIASGRTSQHFGARKPCWCIPQIALMASLPNLSPQSDHSLYLEAAAYGWWYALPNPKGGLFVGYCTEHIDQVRQRSNPLRTLWKNELQKTHLISQLFPKNNVIESVMARSASARSSDRATGERWIAVGDAAFASDPLSGKGLEFAIESAILGANLLLAQEQHTALQEYDNWIREYVGQHEQARDFYFSQGTPYY